MLAALCLAQAQYLFYKLATEKKQSAEMLAKVATKISDYFKEANDLAKNNQATVQFQQGQFKGILAYHAQYFEASAWLVLGIHRFTAAKEEGKDMGQAAATIARAAELLSTCNVKSIPASYSKNWKAKLESAQKLAAQSKEKAATVFFEKLPDYK